MATQSEVEGTKPYQEHDRYAQAVEPPLETETLRQKRDSIAKMCNAAVDSRVLRDLGSLSIGMKTIERSINIHVQVQQVSSLRDRLNALESSANNSLLAMGVMLDDVQQRLNCIEASPRRPSQTIKTQE